MTTETQAAQVGEANNTAYEAELTRLLGAIELGDRAAFDMFYRLTVPRLAAIAQRVTQKTELAEEVLSDVYLQVWNRADRFDDSRGSVLAWLTILCRSRSLDRVRRNRAGAMGDALSIDDVPESVSEEQPQDLLLTVEANTALHTALESLDEQQRQLLSLAYFKGYSHSELAALTGIPIGTVKTRIRRAVILLKEMLVNNDNRGQ